MVDTLDMLKTLRLHDVNDGGEHLAYNLMNHINGFRNKNYHQLSDTADTLNYDKMKTLTEDLAKLLTTDRG